MSSKSLKKVHRTQKLGQDRLVTLIDEEGREIHDRDNIIERIEDSEQSTTIHTDPKCTRDDIMEDGSSTSRYEEWKQHFKI